MAQEKDKKPVSFRVKEVFGELRKVTWPDFKTVLKQTGVVLGVVVFFLLACMGMDAVLGWLYNLLISGIMGL